MHFKKLKPGLMVILAGLVLSSCSHRPWQEISMPAAREVRKGFTEPPPEYGPNLVWGWNGPMDEEVIRRDLDRIRSLGFPSVIIEAGYRMKEPYLSEGWFRLVGYAVEQAGLRGMRVWLIDEGKYPSGFAGGRFSTESPELRMQGLEIKQRIKPAGGVTLDMVLPDNVISAAAFHRDDSAFIILDVQSGRLDWTAPGNGWEVLLVRHRFRTSVTRAVNNPTGGKDTVNSLCDYLNPLATGQFIQYTHEGYMRYLGEEFGKTILGFRGDEPDYGFVPWTGSMVEEFITRKGYDIRPYLAGFYLPGADEELRRAKADYWDVWSGLFADNFFRIQADWCGDNNLEYMVHMNHEDKMMQLVRSGGDFFRNMRDVQIPGVDAIWNQVWMDRVADFPKLASSAAHLNGRPRAMSESFAAYRIRPNVLQGKWVLDHQFARGINFFEIMFYGSSAEGEGRPRGWMASDSFPSLMAYTRRLSWLLSQGRPAAGIALYMPTVGMWLGDQASNATTWEIARQLLEQQRDFDFVDEYALASGLTLTQGTFINGSGQSYHAVIVPAAGIMSAGALKRLERFAASGGRVIFVDHEPAMIYDSVFMEARPFSFTGEKMLVPSNEFASHTEGILPERDIRLDPATASVKYIHRKLKDAEIYFLFNESGERVSCKALLKGSAPAAIMDPFSGASEHLEDFESGNKGLTLDFDMEPWESRVFLLGSAADKNRADAGKKKFQSGAGTKKLQADPGPEKFRELLAMEWKPVFEDSGRGDWEKNWSLDGRKARVLNTSEGMEFYAGEVPGEDSSHSVLWSRRIFQGDVRIEYEYTRLDTALRYVNILYLMASGSGEEGYQEDILEWSDIRKIPAMKIYYDHMNLLHISYAAFENTNTEEGNDYIRARRYMPETGVGLAGTDLSPDYFQTGFFEPGEPHRITVIRQGNDLYMQIRNVHGEMLCRWDLSAFPGLEKGRIGLRHMGSRASRYRDFRVFESVEFNERQQTLQDKNI